jgi:hypothetical protein
MVSMTDVSRLSRRTARLLFALPIALAATSAEAGELFKKHHAPKFELVQAYLVTPTQAPAQPTFVPVPYPVPYPYPSGPGCGHDSGCSGCPAPSPQDGTAHHTSPQLPSKQVASPQIPLFSTLAPQPQAVMALAPQQPQVQGPIIQSAPVQILQAPVPQIQMVQAPAMQQVQMVQVPAVQQVQMAAMPLIQSTSAVAAMPVSAQALAVPAAAQGLTPVQLLLPRQKHCLLGLGHGLLGHCP